MAEDGKFQMNWTDPDKMGAMKIFKQKCELLFDAKGIDEDKQVSRILLKAGDTGLQMYNSWALPEADKKKTALVWQKFEEYGKSQEHFRLARLRLQTMRQKEAETVDQFITQCRLQAQRCKFRDAKETEERIIEQLIAGTANEDAKRELLGKDEKLTLDEAVKIAQCHEAAIHHLSKLKESVNPPATHLQQVDVIRRQKETKNAINVDYTINLNQSNSALHMERHARSVGRGTTGQKCAD